VSAAQKNAIKTKHSSFAAIEAIFLLLFGLVHKKQRRKQMLTPPNFLVNYFRV
jgi:hypothetical protein